MTLDDLMYRQESVASRAQLTAAGLPWHHVRDQVRARRWQLSGSVVVLHNGPLTRTQQLWCAILDQPQSAGLAGISALIAAGFRTMPRKSVHVVVPSHARARRRAGIVLHYADDVDFVAPSGQPPRVRNARAVVQAGMWERDVRVAGGVFVAAFQQRLVTATEVRRELGRVMRQRNIKLMLGLLGDVEDGAGSLAEIEFTRLLARAGLPEPIRQSVRPNAKGGMWYLDIDFGTFAVEIDGPMHWSGNIETELTRQNALVRRRESLIRITTLMLRTDPASVVAEIRAAIRDLGVAA